MSENEIVLSLVQLFAANFYSFLADSLARLVMALDALREGMPGTALTAQDGRGRGEGAGVGGACVGGEGVGGAGGGGAGVGGEGGTLCAPLRVLLASDRSKLKPWMWTLLERFGVDRTNSWPYPIRAYAHTGNLRLAAAARVHVSRLLVVDWQLPSSVCLPRDASCRADGGTTPRAVSASSAAAGVAAASSAAALRPSAYAHLPARAALRRLRERLAHPGAHLGWASPRRLVVYMQRAAAKVRQVANEPELLTAMSAVLGEGAPCDSTCRAPWELRLLSDAPAMALVDVAALLSRTGVLVGVHGAGWANLLFMGPGAHAIEMALPEPHAIYAAHTAYALGVHYHLVPLRGRALHSAARVHAPAQAVGTILCRVVREVARAEWHASGASVGPPPSARVTSTLAQDSARVTSTLAQDSARVTYTLAQDSARETSTVDAPSATPSVELVVARYDEDFRWCIALSANCTVYNKGAVVSASAHAGVARWRTLPNVGRESHTILSHITDQYDALADWTVFMQGAPWDHLPIGLTVAHFLNASCRAHDRDTFFPLTAVAQSDLRGLAFRSGYAPFAPFSGTLVGPPGAWTARNGARLAALLQPLGLWQGAGESTDECPGGRHECRTAALVNRTPLAVTPRRLDAGLSVLPLELHWIEARRAQQGHPGLDSFWRKFLGGAPPTRLFHAQGAQFGVAASAIRRRPRAFYAALLDEVRHQTDPVAGYYCELIWWYVFDQDAAAQAARW